MSAYLASSDNVALPLCEAVLRALGWLVAESPSALRFPPPPAPDYSTSADGELWSENEIIVLLVDSTACWRLLWRTGSCALGRRWVGRVISGRGGLLWYTFISSCNRNIHQYMECKKKHSTCLNYKVSHTSFGGSSILYASSTTGKPYTTSSTRCTRHIASCSDIFSEENRDGSLTPLW
jgi:hypothetical protein